MFDFSKVVSGALTKEWILSRVDEFAIMRYYFGDFKLGNSYRSKFDSRDTNPSTGFFIGKSGELVYRDFRTNQTWNCFTFVMELYRCNYKQALERIANDFGLIDTSTRKVSSQILEEASKIERENKPLTVIQFIPDKWTDKHLKFWRYFEITKEELEAENVYPGAPLFVNKNEIFNRNDHLRFAFIEQYEDKTGVKIYSPFDPQMKWLTNIPLSVPFGLNNLNYNSDTVFITKSKKDLIILKKLFPSVIATQNESEQALTTEIQEMLKSKFKNRIIIFDNDDVGVANCTKFNDKGFGYFNIPKKHYLQYGIKDPSDFVKFYGLDRLRELFESKGLL